jgi:hypothetical protein
MLLMYIDQHIEFHTGKPTHTLENLMQYAMAFRAMTGGKKLNLTLDQDEQDEEEQHEQPEERAVPKKKAAPAKVKIEIPDEDEELKAALLRKKKEILRAREIQHLHARLEALREEEEYAEASD